MGIVIAAFLAHLAIGSYEWINPVRLVGLLAAGRDGHDSLSSIVWDIRLPRAVACLFVGAILGGVGSAFQALFRNPLAEPYVIGVSSGAAVGGSLAIVLGLGSAFAGLGLQAMAIAGGLGALALVTMLASRQGVLHAPTLLVAGVVVGAMLSSVVTLILVMAGMDSGKVLRWMMGSMTPMFWDRVVILAGALLLGGCVLVRSTRELNVLAIADDHAATLGVQTDTLRKRVLVAGTAMVAVAVGTVGIIAFLGLNAPHIARRIMGSDLRHSLAGSAMLGAAILALADILAQRLLSGTELPVGAVTAVLGAPALIALLRVRRA